MLLRAQSRADPIRMMETHQHQQRLIGSDRLLGLYSWPEYESAFELNEDEIFLTGIQPPHHSPIIHKSPKPKPNPNFRSQIRRRFLEHADCGILAALPDHNPNPNLMPKVSISISIPVKKREEAAAEEEKAYPSSAPVRIPAAVNGRQKGLMVEVDDVEEEELKGVMTLPPHEMVERRWSPMTTFSVLEGKGRTLKGKDLRRVRNAVFWRMGFED